MRKVRTDYHVNGLIHVSEDPICDKEQNVVLFGLFLVQCLQCVTIVRGVKIKIIVFYNYPLIVRDVGKL